MISNINTPDLRAIYSLKEDKGAPGAGTGSDSPSSCSARSGLPRLCGGAGVANTTISSIDWTSLTQIELQKYPRCCIGVEPTACGRYDVNLSLNGKISYFGTYDTYRQATTACAAARISLGLPLEQRKCIVAIPARATADGSCIIGRGVRVSTTVRRAFNEAEMTFKQPCEEDTRVGPRKSSAARGAVIGKASNSSSDVEKEPRWCCNNDDDDTGKRDDEDISAAAALAPLLRGELKTRKSVRSSGLTSKSQPKPPYGLPLDKGQRAPAAAEGGGEARMDKEESSDNEEDDESDDDSDDTNSDEEDDDDADDNDSDEVEEEKENEEDDDDADDKDSDEVEKEEENEEDDDDADDYDSDDDYNSDGGNGESSSTSSDPPSPRRKQATSRADLLPRKSEITVFKARKKGSSIDWKSLSEEELLKYPRCRIGVGKLQWGNYRVRISIEGTKMYIGTYRTFNQASAACAAARISHGLPLTGRRKRPHPPITMPSPERPSVTTDSPARKRPRYDERSPRVEGRGQAPVINHSKGDRGGPASSEGHLGNSSSVDWSSLSLDQLLEYPMCLIGVRRMPSGRYRVCFSTNGKSTYFGTFDTFLQASAACAAARLQRGLSLDRMQGGGRPARPSSLPRNSPSFLQLLSEESSSDAEQQIPTRRSNAAGIARPAASRQQAPSLVSSKRVAVASESLSDDGRSKRGRHEDRATAATTLAPFPSSSKKAAATADSLSDHRAHKRDRQEDRATAATTSTSSSSLSMHRSVLPPCMSSASAINSCLNRAKESINSGLLNTASQRPSSAAVDVNTPQRHHKPTATLPIPPSPFSLLSEISADSATSNESPSHISCQRPRSPHRHW